jgi:hypothetical protein
MHEILSKKHYRRVFFVLVLLILFFALTVRFFTLPGFDAHLATSPAELIAAILDHLVVALFVTVVIGCFVFWITPDIVRRSNIDVVDPKQINSLLKDATRTSKIWIYKGACGRFTRATTFPKLAEAARQEGIGRDISVYILNPKNEALCAEYATYRRSLKSGNTGTPWTSLHVQEEIIATAVSAMKFQYSEPLLRIKVFFVDHFSAFRFDISDQYVVVTKEEKEASALKADSGTFFYDSYRDDVRLVERQCFPLNSTGKIGMPATLTEDAVRDAIRVAGIVDEQTINSLNLGKITAAINNPVDPY